MPAIYTVPCRDPSEEGSVHCFGVLGYRGREGKGICEYNALQISHLSMIDTVTADLVCREATLS